MTGSRAAAASACLLLSLSSCRFQTGGATKAVLPARVENPKKEADLPTVILTPEAEGRLGIRLTEVALRSVVRTRLLGGEIVIPPGRSVVVAAPVAGTLRSPHGAQPVVAGQPVKKGQPVFDLQILLTPPDRVRLAELLVSLAQARVEAEGQVEKANVQVQATRTAVNRAEQLVRDKAGSVKSLDEATAQLETALATLKAAEARRDLLVQTTIETEASSQKSLVIEAPDDGHVRDIAAVADQIVSAGTRLFEVVRDDLVWIRVPVYVGDLASIDDAQPASIGELTSADSKSARVANPVAAPPSASAAAATTDLYYAAENLDGSLRPGQRVGAVLKLRDKEPSLVVPRSAVWHDSYGGTWVYERTGPQTFIRRRVQVRFVVDSEAVLVQPPDDRGLKSGSEVVSSGVAELSGTEFGFGK